MVVGVVPEIHQHLLHSGLIGGDGHPFAEHEAGGNLDNGEGDGVGVIGFVAGVMDLQVG